ncbi:MAG: hypothetical protein ACYTGZ_16245 [Planctomycetota bacterium]|jgi:hypothetical protein
MNRHHFVYILLLIAACTGSEPVHTDEEPSEWTIGDLGEAALEELQRAPEESAQVSRLNHTEMEPRSEGRRARRSGRGGGGSYRGPSGSVPAGVRAPTSPAMPGRKDGTTRSARTWRRSSLAPHTSKLKVGATHELPLEATHVTARVDGFRARVVLDLFYRNDKDKQLRGVLKLRLPQGASPDFTAFGISAKAAMPAAPETSLARIREQRPETVKEARMVPREKAAHAFGETVRRKVDPALVEWAGAGIFNIQIFPIEAGKLHQVTVAYDVDLVPVGDKLEYRLDLPEKAGAVVVDLLVNGGEHTLNGKAGEAKGRYRFDKPEERSFRVRVPGQGSIALTGSDAATDALYAMRFTPKVPDQAGDPSGAAVFLIDTSLSSNPARFNIWLDLMREVLVRNRATLKRYRVGFFDIQTRWWRDGKLVDNTAKNTDALLRDAKRFALEGATDIGQALRAAARFEGKSDLFLLSDGAATWGERDPTALHTKIGNGQTLFAYTTGEAGTDAEALRHLARESGGAVFSATGEGDLPGVATAHTKRPWRIVGIDAPGSDALLRGRPLTIFPDQSLVVSGRGALDKDSAVTLKLQQGDRTIEVATKPDTVLASPLAANVYGQTAVQQLEEFAHLTERDARAYALHFRVVGRTCSLLMLETEEDYKRFEIEPVEEQKTVRSRPASTAVATALKRRATELEDPKARLLAWLTRLEGMPGLKFKVNDHVRGLMAAAQPGDFDVAPRPLDCPTRLWTEIPGAIQEQLASRKLKYDDIAAEAARRKEATTAADGLKALSSLVEQSPGNAGIARDVGFTAMEWGLGGEAYHLFRRVAEARPYEPQNYVAMAQCLDALGKRRLASIWYEVALSGEWNSRFGSFREIATVHYLSFLRRHKDDRLETLVPTVETKAADLIVTVFWNTDNSDVDLHVRDADGEVCYYNHKETKMGGRITADVTTGFGPEMFVLKEAKPGTYGAWAHYYSEDTTRASTRTKVYATIFENWGREDEKAHRRTVVLASDKKQHGIATMNRKVQP